MEPLELPDFETLAETVGAAIFILQGNKFRYVNPATEAITGYSRSELLEMDFWQVAHPEHREMVKERGLGRQRGGEVPSSYQFKLLTKKGEVRWGEFSGSLIQYGGRPAVLGTAIDITERKTVERVLGESDDGVAVTVEGKIVTFNPKFAELVGRPPDDLTGLDPMDFPVPEDRERAAARMRAVIEGGAEFPSEYRVQRPDGTVLPVEVVSLLISYDGERALLSVVRDTTPRVQAQQALRESEERFRRMAETTSAAIVISQGAQITYMNPAAEKLVGLTQDEVFASEDPWQFIHPDDRLGLQSRIARRDSGADIDSLYQFRIVRKDGDERWVESTATRIELEGEQAEIAVVIDITERVRAQEELRRAREELERRVEQQMSQGQSYDLTFRERVVLNLVAEGKPDKEIAADLSISPATAQKHVSNILRKMNATSRTEAGVRAVREGLLG